MLQSDTKIQSPVLIIPVMITKCQVWYIEAGIGDIIEDI